MLGLRYWILCLPDQKKYNKIQEAQVLIHFLVRPASQSKQHLTSSRILRLFRDYNLISGDLTWYHVLQDSDPEANHFLPQRQVCPCLRHMRCWRAVAMACYCYTISLAIWCHLYLHPKSNVCACHLPAIWVDELMHLFTKYFLPSPQLFLNGWIATPQLPQASEDERCLQLNDIR